MCVFAMVDSSSVVWVHQPTTAASNFCETTRDLHTEKINILFFFVFHFFIPPSSERVQIHTVWFITIVWRFIFIHDSLPEKWSVFPCSGVEFGQLNCVFNSYYWKCVFIHVLLVFCFCLREIRCTSIIVCGRLTEDADRNKNTRHSFTYLEVLNLHITTFQLNTKPLKYPFYINFKLWWVEASFRGLLHRWPDSWIASANILEASLNVKSWTIRICWMNNNANNHTGDDDSPRTQNHMAKAKTKYIQNIIVFQFLYDRPQSINLWHIKW